MRIVFMGTPEFAIPSLRILVDHGYDVVGVVTAPDRPSGRGLQLTPSPVKEYAVSKGLKVLQPEKLRDPSFLEELQATKPDLAVVVAFRMLPLTNPVMLPIPLVRSSKNCLNRRCLPIPDTRTGQ